MLDLKSYKRLMSIPETLKPLKNSRVSQTQTWAATSNTVAGAHGIRCHLPQNKLLGAGWHCRKWHRDSGSHAKGSIIHEQMPW
jgi:hypothetical protein